MKAELGRRRTASVAIIKAEIFVILQTLMIATQAVRRWIAAKEVVQDSIGMTRVSFLDNILQFNYMHTRMCISVTKIVDHFSSAKLFPNALPSLFVD